MSEPSKRKQQRRRKHSQNKKVQSPANLDRPLHLIFEAIAQLQDYVSNSVDRSSAQALAEERLSSAVRELATLAEPYDIFDVLELVRLHNLTADPETYRETTHEGTSAAVELTALILATREDPGGLLPNVSGHRPNASAVIDQIQAAAQACFNAGSMLGLFRAGDDPLARISFVSVLREAAVRNMAYPHMLEDTLTSLFSDAAIEEDCRQAMGVTAAQIMAVLNAAEPMQISVWQERFEPFLNVMNQAMAQGKVSAPPPDSLRNQVADAWQTAWSNPADVSVIDPASLALRANVDVNVVLKVLDLFSLSLVGRDPMDVVSDFFRGSSPLRTRPILCDAIGRRVVVHGGLLLPAIRERVEEALKQKGIWSRYDKRRGAYLEEAALALLTPHLPGAVIHKSFEYLVPDPDAAAPQTDPASYTKLAEADGLLLVDDIAIIVEAKAANLSPMSRMGHFSRLRRDLGKIVTDAANQGDRLKLQILKDRGLRLRDGSWMNLQQVREIHNIALSLEDLSGLVTITHELVSAGLLKGPELPWVVSLHDLRVISEVLVRPAELLLYMRRRTESEVTRKFHAFDELDFFLYTLHDGLYVEPDPLQVERELPQFGAPSVATRRRYARQMPKFLTSHTDELDAWYFYRQGLRQTPAQQPMLNAVPDLLELVDALADRREPGWLSMGATLLDGSSKVQRDWATLGPGLAEQSAFDGQPHTCAILGGSRAASSFVVIWASMAPQQSLSSTEQRLSEYVAAKKHQMQVARGFGLLFDAEGQLASTYFDNRPPGPNSMLDATVVRLGLKPAGQMSRHVPRPRKTPRRGR